MGEGGWDVFVSYGHEDAQWVGVLLADAELPVFLFLANRNWVDFRTATTGPAYDIAG